MLGPLFVDIEGHHLTGEDREILQHPLVGGVIYFSRNFESYAQIVQLTKSIKALREPSLLIAVDHEGGRVQRFRKEFTVLPPLRSIGAVFDTNPEKALDYSFHHGWLMAAELRMAGIDFSFSPVLDIDYGRSSVIGDRAFHYTPAIVARLARVYIDGMKAAGMPATGKHFPGHGWAYEDSHTAIPHDEREFEMVWQQDMAPYLHLYNEGLAAVMPAHVIYNAYDDMPACFSARWLQNILRKKIGFQGLIISDDLSMDGASVVAESISDRAIAALGAGCDAALICNNRAAVVETLDRLNYTGSEKSRFRLELLRGAGMQGIQNDNYSHHWNRALQVVAAFSGLTT